MMGHRQSALFYLALAFFFFSVAVGADSKWTTLFGAWTSGIALSSAAVHLALDARERRSRDRVR